jgi:Fur family transcriptional regulator, peroxide stress response regulator
MSWVEKKNLDGELNQRLATSGLRFTPQRRHIYNVLLEKSDHPTAEDVFMRAKQGMSDISIATVYNCLDALVRCGLVRQVNLDRNASRFCPNMKEHCHFYCEECSRIYDIALSPGAEVKIPKGFKVTHHEVSFRGLCPKCGQ